MANGNVNEPSTNSPTELQMFPFKWISFSMKISYWSPFFLAPPEIPTGG